MAIDERMIPHPTLDGVWRRAKGKLWRIRVVDAKGRVRFVGAFVTARQAAWARSHDMVKLISRTNRARRRKARQAKATKP